jgi:DNA-binding FadR family transcriptional regulator
MSPLAPLRKISLADQVAERLKAEILAGRLSPGEHLPPERELAVSLGTNRGTLREAVRGLEALGLVRVRQGDGVRVLDFRRDGELHLLPSYLSGDAPTAERTRALSDALRFRAVVLADGAALAASRAEPQDLERLRAAHETAVAAFEGGDPAAVVRADLAFYRVLLDASHSVVAVWIFNTFLRSFEELVARMPGLWVAPPAYPRTLGAAVRSILAGRPRAARAALERHLRSGDHHVLSVLETLGKEGT